MCWSKIKISYDESLPELIRIFHPKRNVKIAIFHIFFLGKNTDKKQRSQIIHRVIFLT